MQRVAITLTFSADLDRMPGWGFDPKDWADLVEDTLTRQKHYKPEVDLQQIQVQSYIWNGDNYVLPKIETVLAPPGCIAAAHVKQSIDALEVMLNDVAEAWRRDGIDDRTISALQFAAGAVRDMRHSLAQSFPSLRRRNDGGTG